MVSLIYLATGRTSYFNEVLSVIYADGQKMNWHDDGEKGLSLANESVIFSDISRGRTGHCLAFVGQPSPDVLEKENYGGTAGTQRSRGSHHNPRAWGE